MNQHILYILGTFTISMVCGFIAIPIIIRFCRKKELYDRPNSRKVHKCSVPRLGGICFIPSMIISSIIMMFVFNQNAVNNEINISLWSIFFVISLMLLSARLPLSKRSSMQSKVRKLKKSISSRCVSALMPSLKIQ